MARSPLGVHPVLPSLHVGSEVIALSMKLFGIEMLKRRMVILNSDEI